MPQDYDRDRFAGYSESSERRASCEQRTTNDRSSRDHRLCARESKRQNIRALSSYTASIRLAGSVLDHAAIVEQMRLIGIEAESSAGYVRTRAPRNPHGERDGRRRAVQANQGTANRGRYEGSTRNMAGTCRPWQDVPVGPLALSLKPDPKWVRSCGSPSKEAPQGLHCPPQNLQYVTISECARSAECRSQSRRSMGCCVTRSTPAISGTAVEFRRTGRFRAARIGQTLRGGPAIRRARRFPRAGARHLTTPTSRFRVQSSVSMWSTSSGKLVRGRRERYAITPVAPGLVAAG